MQSLFYELVQVAVGEKKNLSRMPSEEEWKFMLEKAQEQAVTGILLDALDLLAEHGQKPPLDILFEWIGIGEQIRRQNQAVNKRCKEVTQLFEDAGYKTCVLKGQGNAQMYPNPLARQSGDIDIWVFGERDEITSFVKERTPDVFEQEHHIDFPIYDDVPVEVHYTPGVLFSPKYNRRFQDWCEEQKIITSKNAKDTEFNVPSVEFNAVYQMAHIMIHFFIEGIGLRHFIDYYYVLIRFHDSRFRGQVIQDIKWLGMEKFARGAMWIEKYCLGLEDEYLLFEPSERVGRLIIKEMEEGGNLGQYDSRYTERNKGLLFRGFVDTKRLVTLFPVFPYESFWKVVEKVTNQRWKLKKII